jgi:formate hydrogenlyase transcriptional activator
MNSAPTNTNLLASSERYRKLLEINNAIITNLTQDSLLNAICKALEGVLPVFRAAITLYSPERDTIRIIAMSSQWNLDYFRIGTEVSRAATPSGWPIVHQRPLVCADTEAAHDYPVQKLYVQEGLRSYCIVPLILAGKSVGTLNIGSDEKNAYSDADAEFLNEIGVQVALAVGNMKSYQEIAALSAKVERTAERYRTLLEINNAIITNLSQGGLLNAICGALERVLPVYRAALNLYDPATDTIRIHALSTHWNSDYFQVGVEMSRTDSHSGWVLDNRRPLLCPDIAAAMKYPVERRLLEEGIQSYCVVPLILGEKAIGTLNIGSDTKGRYSEADAEFLLEIGNQVALAVGNMQSYQEIAALNIKVEHTAERYRTLLEINNAIITNLSQEALLHSISEVLSRVIPFDRAAFTLYIPSGRKFRFLAIEGITASSHFRAGQEFEPEESVSAWVFENQRPALRGDLKKEQHYLNDRRLLEEGLNSYCVAPLMIGGKSIGTLNLASQKTNQYSEADAEFLCELGSQVALAVSNMTSYEEIAALNAKVERSAERYRTLLGINNAIVTHLTPEALLHSVSDILRGIVPYSGAAVTIFYENSRTFRYLAMDGTIPTDYFRAGLEFERTETISAWVFEHQRGVIRGDLEKEQKYPNDARLLAKGIYSDCIVPLILGGKSIGTLNVGSTKRNQYSQENLETLQEIAGQIALAVANMKAYEEIIELKARLEKENIYLQDEIRTEHNFEEIVGNSPALLAVLRKVEQVAPTDSTVLIYGETGTGKELIARAIHEHSTRAKRPLLKVNCSAISAGLVESELFGHVKGAFTGAFERHIGRFELADGGTIFLDEIGELPLETQVKLLRVLQEREFEPVGSNRPVRVDVRVIAATNRDLKESIRNGTFRSDLYYRLNVFPIDMPSLRERHSDIPQLAMFFLSRFAKKFGKDIQGISRATLDRLVAYSWPGNIRELQNVIERAAILSQRSVLELGADTVPLLTAAGSPAMVDERSAGGASESLPPLEPTAATLEEIERNHIVAILNQTQGVVEGPRGAAKILGLHPNTLRHRIQKLGLKRSAYRES